MTRNVRLLALSIVGAAALAGAVPAMAAEFVGLITKTDSNPFFVKMKEGRRKRPELGVELRDLQARIRRRQRSQVAAIESLISAGAKGFAIVAERFKRHRPDDPEGPQRGAARDRARYAARSDRCRRRDVRHR